MEIEAVKQATGIYFACDTCGKIAEFADGCPPEFDYADVRVRLDGTVKKFTIVDFRKRLGFDN